MGRGGAQEEAATCGKAAGARQAALPTKVLLDTWPAGAVGSQEAALQSLKEGKFPRYVVAIAWSSRTSWKVRWRF